MSGSEYGVGWALDRDDETPQLCLNPFWDYPTKGFILGSYGTNTVGNEAYKRFRKLLADARKSANLTQQELALRLKRPQSFVSKYERGERRLDVVEFDEVAKALGIDPIRFLRQFYGEET
jgi:Helix-turn-helix